MNFVYRMQDAEGRGPWKPGFSELWAEDRTPAEYLALYPIPVKMMHDFRRLAGTKHMGYGCETIEDLRLWFKFGEHLTLRNYGYRVVRIEVDEILCRTITQLLFTRSIPLSKDVQYIDLY